MNLSLIDTPSTPFLEPSLAASVVQLFDREYPWFNRALFRPIMHSVSFYVSGVSAGLYRKNSDESAARARFLRS